MGGEGDGPVKARQALGRAASVRGAVSPQPGLGGRRAAGPRGLQKTFDLEITKSCSRIGHQKCTQADLRKLEVRRELQTRYIEDTELLSGSTKLINSLGEAEPSLSRNVFRK